MFHFRIITTPDGNQIIDRNLSTPYESLTPTQMVEYTEIDNQLTIMDWLLMTHFSYRTELNQIIAIQEVFRSGMKKNPNGKIGG